MFHELVVVPDLATPCRAFPNFHHGPRRVGGLSQSSVTGRLIRGGCRQVVHAHLAIFHPVSVDAAGDQSPAALDPCGLSGDAGADRGVGEIGLQPTQQLGTGDLGGSGAPQRRTGDGPDRDGRRGAAGVVGRLSGEDSGREPRRAETRGQTAAPWLGKALEHPHRPATGHAHPRCRPDEKPEPANRTALLHPGARRAGTNVRHPGKQRWTPAKPSRRSRPWPRPMHKGNGFIRLPPPIKEQRYPISTIIWIP